MKVICYNNKTTGGKILDSLTLGKIYDSIQDLPYEEDNLSQTSPNWVAKILDDKGQEMWYNSEMIMSIDKWRESKLNRLGL